MEVVFEYNLWIFGLSLTRSKNFNTLNLVLQNVELFSYFKIKGNI